MKEVKLPSGATLLVNAAPFSESKALWQASMAELRSIQASSSMDMGNFYKDVFCAGFSSPAIDAALAKCLARCAYRGADGKDLKIDADTFDPVERRQDYVTVVAEVAKENLGPFVKSLYAQYQLALTAMAIIGSPA